MTRAAQPVRPARAMIELFVEAYRLHLLRGLEEGLARCGYGLIAGVDEVGRGSLAGPVVAAAVILDCRCLVPGRGRQQVPDRRRAGARRRRPSAPTPWPSPSPPISPEIIDRINILEATRLAMREALSRLRPAPDCAVVDAVRLSGFGFPCLPVVRGDCFSYAVACASILAKVERDRMMVELDREYPQYGFADAQGLRRAGAPGGAVDLRAVARPPADLQAGAAARGGPLLMAVQREQVVQTAEKYVSRGKIEPAIREYRKLLADNPNDINTLNRIGDLYARIQRIDEAVDFFTQIAEQYSTEGFFVKAIAIYKKIIKLDPTRLEVYEKLAELYHRQGLVNEARTQYQVLADYYQKHDNAASAIAIYQKMARPGAEQPELPRQARRDLPVAAADREGDERVPRHRRDDDRPRPAAGRGPGLRAGAGHRQQQPGLHQRRRLQAQGIGRHRRRRPLPGHRRRAQSRRRRASAAWPGWTSPRAASRLRQPPLAPAPAAGGAGHAEPRGTRRRLRRRRRSRRRSRTSPTAASA